MKKWSVRRRAVRALQVPRRELFRLGGGKVTPVSLSYAPLRRAGVGEGPGGWCCRRYRRRPTRGHLYELGVERARTTVGRVHRREMMSKAVNLATSVAGVRWVGIAAATLLLVLCVAPSSVLAATSVSGQITGNTVWSSSRSPYVLTDNTTVASGARLTINPGVRVESAGRFRLNVVGRLWAVGTPADPIDLSIGSGLNFYEGSAGRRLPGRPSATVSTSASRPRHPHRGRPFTTSSSATTTSRRIPTTPPGELPP